MSIKVTVHLVDLVEEAVETVVLLHKLALQTKDMLVVSVAPQIFNAEVEAEVLAVVVIMEVLEEQAETVVSV